MATFSQHHVDGLDLALTPLQYMLKCFPLTKDQEQRCALYLRTEADINMDFIARSYENAWPCC